MAFLAAIAPFIGSGAGAAGAAGATAAATGAAAGAAGGAAAGAAGGAAAGAAATGAYSAAVAGELAASVAGGLASTAASIAPPTLATGSAAAGGMTALQAGSLASTLISGGYGAYASNRAGLAQAAALRSQAKSENAVAQREMRETMRQTRYAVSRGRAVAAASGAGADDVTVSNTLAGLEAEGEYRALTALYNGQVGADYARAQASNALSEGRAGAFGSLMKAGTTLLNSDTTADWLEKYG